MLSASLNKAFPFLSVNKDMFCCSVLIQDKDNNHLMTRGSFHKAILATIDLSYLQLPALIFTSVPRNNFKTIVNPDHIEKKILFHVTG